jgi:guanylate kinase
MIVILSGPSGVGKDTVIDAWRAADPRIERVVTYTTRKPRAGEVDGRDYNFVDLETFRHLLNQGHFWEHKVVHGHYYASPKKDTEAIIEKDKIPVLKIDVQGALEVMHLRPDALTVFILPPSLEELEARIRGRKTDDEETIQKRLRNAHDEIALADRYQLQIVNDEIDVVVRKLIEAVK